MTTKVANFDSLSDRRIGPPPLTAAVTSWNGLTGDVKGTLAEIWAFGAGDVPLVDNLFAFPSGNLRFVGSTANGFLPASGFFESSTTPGDPQVGTDVQHRYFPGGGIGGFVGDEFVGFNPAWNGTFAGMNGLQVISEKVAFGHGTTPQTGPGAELLLAQQTWWQISGFFDGPDYWPLVGFNSGNREDLLISLYNGEDLGTAPRVQMTGWGTYLGFPRMSNHGTTAAFDTQIDVANSFAPAAGDGVGWFVRRRTDDPPKGVLRWFTVDGDLVAGKSGWEFYGADGAGTLAKLLSLDPVNGAVFGVPVSVPGAIVPQMFISPSVIDFTTLGDTVVVPAKPGYVFIAVGSTAGIKLIYNVMGATAGPTVSIFNNPSANNYAATVAVNATGGTVSGPPCWANVQQVAIATLFDLSTPITLRVSVAAAGGALTGRVTLFGAIVPIASVS